MDFTIPRPRPNSHKQRTPASEVSEQIEKLDRGLSILLEQARRLRSCRNALSPTCRLPPEVLSTIFMWIPSWSLDDFESPSVKDWFRVTHVCRHWRAVALGCATLWNRVDVMCTAWAPEMVLRSKSASLSVRAKVYYPKDQTLLVTKSVLAQISRIQDLHLGADGRSFNNLLINIVAEAPRLHSLVLSNSHWRAHMDELCLPFAFLCGGAPRLKRLELRKFSVSWECPLFLTSHKVTTFFMEGLERNKPNMSQLLAVLENMPLLETLHLEGVVPNPKSCAAPQRVVCLDHLRTLHLSSEMLECANLLQHISIPQTTRMSLMSHAADKLEDVSLLVSAITTARGKMPFHAFSFQFNPAGVCLRSGQEMGSLENCKDDELHRNADLSLVFSTTVLDQMFLSETLHILFQGLPLAFSAVKAFLAHDYEGLMVAEVWTDILRRMPNIRTLHACHDAALHLPSALAAGNASHGDPHTPEELVPQLETVVLHAVDTNWSVNSIPYLHLLQDSQITRCNRDIPIAELRISRCLNIGKKEIRTLCHLFTEVDWDGFEVYVRGTSVANSGSSESEIEEYSHDEWNGYEGLEGLGWWNT